MALSSRRNGDLGDVVCAGRGRRLRRFSLAELPPLPDGSRIRIKETDGGVPLLVLDFPVGIVERWGLVLFLSGVLVGASVCGVIYCIQQIQLRFPWFVRIFVTIYYVLLLAAFVAGGCVLIRFIWGLIRGEDAESLTLGECQPSHKPCRLTA